MCCLGAFSFFLPFPSHLIETGSCASYSPGIFSISTTVRLLLLSVCPLPLLQAPGLGPSQGGIHQPLSSLLCCVGNVPPHANHPASPHGTPLAQKLEMMMVVCSPEVSRAPPINHVMQKCFETTTGKPRSYNRAHDTIPECCHDSPA